MSSYIPVIGLEIHAELLTKSKVFCTCSAEFGGSQNSRCCPVCTGMPGTLPVINQTAVEYAVKAGMALGCDISKFSVFDRKNYFYPDLPKAYQISQLYYPLCLEGKVAIDTPDGQKYIRINHIHLEEDAGKLVHDDFNAVSLADYNRCGIPLVEIVTEPDISSAEEAKAFIEKVMLLLQYAGVSDCKMEEGSLRCDVNVSIMRPGDKELGTRAEIKNMNSLKSITRAINYEIKRQSRLLDAGKKVVQETRRFNENKGETSSMRSKENAHDYRYFPEPDILQVNFTDEMLDSIKNMLPELPYKRMERYMKDYGLSKTDAQILINQKSVSDFYDAAVSAYNAPKSIANGIFNAYLPGDSYVTGQVAFENPSVYGTLTIPGTASNIITVAAYDQVNASITGFSGRGFTSDNAIKPDIAAPGVGVTVSYGEYGYGNADGTSLAAAFVSGCAALIMEWGIVLGNDPYMYGERVKAQLIRGAKPLGSLGSYPNRYTGWGTVCMENSFKGLIV